MKTLAAHPLASTFLRLTLAITLGIVAVIVAFAVLKIVLVAAVLAGLVLGALFLYNIFKKRGPRLPVVR